MATLLLTYAFRCQTCNCANKDELVLAAHNRDQLVGFMSQAHLGCKACGQPRVVDQGVKISLRKPAPLTDGNTRQRGITLIA